MLGDVVKPTQRWMHSHESQRPGVNGGYIIRISPAEIGIEVVPTLKRFRNGTTPGASQPGATPKAMAAKIPPCQIAVEKRQPALFTVVSYDRPI